MNSVKVKEINPEPAYYDADDAYDVTIPVPLTSEEDIAHVNLQHLQENDSRPQAFTVFQTDPASFGRYADNEESVQAQESTDDSSYHTPQSQ